MSAEDRAGSLTDRVTSPSRATAKLYRFDPFVLDPSLLSLKRHGEEIHLRHKTFHVLLYLIENRHRTVTKQELWSGVWEDSAVTDDALVQCVKDIRRALGDDVRNPRYIRTLPRTGYRFMGAVEDAPAPQPVDEGGTVLPRPAAPVALNPDPRPVAAASQPEGRRRAVVGRMLAAVAAVLLLVVVGQPAFPLRARLDDVPAPAATGRPTVMVMYLENESRSADLDWLRQGLADMLISGFARSDRLTVLGRQHLDVLQRRHFGASGRGLSLDRAMTLAEGAQARTVVLGTFGRMGDRLRVDVQMYDTGTARLIASERVVVDRPAQILSEIDLLSLRLASRLGGAPAKMTGSLPDVMTNNLEAYRYYSLAVDKAHALLNTEAIELLQRAVTLDPDFAMAHARIGYIHAVTWAHPEQAKPHLQKAFNLSSRLTSRDRLNISAWYAIANYDFPQAIRIYRRMLASYPPETEVYLRLSKLLMGEGRLDESLEVAGTGLAFDPEAPELQNLMAGLYGREQKFDQAIEYARRYVAYAPHEPNAYDTLGLLLTTVGDYRGGAAQFERALEINPRFEVARIHLANTYVREGRYREAAAEFMNYVEGAPSDSERWRGWAGLSDLARRRQRVEEARAYARRQATLLPASPPWQQVLDALDRGDSAFVAHARAEREGRQGVDRGQRGNGRFKAYEFGVIALKQGRHDEALGWFRRALTFPAPAWSHDDLETGLGDALLETGRWDEAVVEYERILGVNPNYALARYGLARAYEEGGRFDSAARQYRRFLDTWQTADRDVPEVVAAQARLAALAAH